MNEEDNPISQNNETKKHNKTVVIETHQEIKKIHSHKHSGSHQKKSEEKHHHHESKNNEKEYSQKEKHHQEKVQMQSEKKNKSNHVHFHHQINEANYSRERDELRKWKAFGDHLIDMLLMSIPKSEIPSIPQVGKMAAIETLCTSLCRLVQNPSQIPQYQALETKYNKCKNQMKSMRKKCAQLHIEVQKNQQMLYHHMQSIHQKEEAVVEKKLHKLETILTEQCKIQQMQFASLDDFDFSHSQNQQYFISQNSPPRVHTNKIIKTKKTVNVSTNKAQISPNFTDLKSDDEYSSEESASENENDSYNENNDTEVQNFNENKKEIIIIEEEEDNYEVSSPYNSNIDQQTVQPTESTTVENS